jgi:hypothetical protein
MDRRGKRVIARSVLRKHPSIPYSCLRSPGQADLLNIESWSSISPFEFVELASREPIHDMRSPHAKDPNDRRSSTIDSSKGPALACRLRTASRFINIVYMTVDMHARNAGACGGSRMSCSYAGIQHSSWRQYHVVPEEQTRPV